MARSPRFTWGGTIGISALVLTGCAVLLMLLTAIFGGVKGTEFNPQTFERREFSFYEIPLVRFQVTSIVRVDRSGPVEQLVQAQKYVTPDPQAPEDWHLITLSRRATTLPPTDVQILIRYFDAEDESASKYWNDWSLQHPELAALLWPEVARLARLQLYVLMPPLFELAKNTQGAAAFQTALKDLQTQQLQQTADRFQQRSEMLDETAAKEQLAKHAADIAAAAQAAETDLSKELKKADEQPAKAEAESG